MKMQELQTQRDAVRWQMKMALHHADCIGFDAGTMSAHDALISQAEKGLTEAKRLKKMVEEFHQPEKN